MLFLTGYKLLIDDWRGYILAGFALVWIANLYMSIFAFLRQGIKKEKTEINIMTKTEEPVIFDITGDKKSESLWFAFLYIHFFALLFFLPEELVIHKLKTKVKQKA